MQTSNEACVTCRPVLRITLEPIGRLSQLGQAWTALEREADAGFFRSWDFIGCLAEERFAGARLLRATQDGADVALALLGGAGRRRWLNETGSAEADRVFIEHNGMLAAPGHGQACVAALAQACGLGGTLVLSGIDDAGLEQAGQAGWLVLQQSRFAPAVDLAELGSDYMASLSANTRAQIRRARRAYGPDLHLARACSVEQAQSWFGEMAALHQAAWARRGEAGAFASPHIRRFHSELIARAWPGGRVDLLRVTAGQRVVGLLYVFICDGRVLSYQSGLAYDGPDRRAKPGLVCHALAIEHYAAAGARLYDLLAGAERYKLSLAHGGQMLHWASLHRPWSAAGLAARARAKAATIRARLGPASAGGAAPAGRPAKKP